MNKVYKLLHKKLDHKLEKDKEFVNRKAIIEAALKEDKLECVNKDEFDFYRNEITCRGIHNKKIIEDAYFQGIVKMHEYLDCLNFNEKKRMMNYEIHECLRDLIHFNNDEAVIYIPFFDEKMNSIYQNSIVLFDLKQYHRIINDYEDLFVKDCYGIKAYQSAFSSLDVIGQYENMVTMFDSYTKRLFFLKKLQSVEFITLSNVNDDCLKELSLAYFYNDMDKMIDVLETTNNINDKIAKKARKYLNRK